MVQLGCGTIEMCHMCHVARRELIPEYMECSCLYSCAHLCPDYRTRISDIGTNLEGTFDTGISPSVHSTGRTTWLGVITATMAVDPDMSPLQRARLGTHIERGDN